MTTGFPYLDKALGGYPEHSVLVEHDPGAGGTLLGAGYLLEGIRNGERIGVLLAGASSADVRKKLEDLGLFDGRNARITLSGPDPEDLLEELARMEECPDRLLIDSLSQMVMMGALEGVDPRVCRNVTRLKRFLSKMGESRGCGHVMALMHYKIAHPEIRLFLEDAFEGVLRLEYSGRTRVLRIVKWPWKVRKTVIPYKILREGLVFSGRRGFVLG